MEFSRQQESLPSPGKMHTKKRAITIKLAFSTWCNRVCGWEGRFRLQRSWRRYDLRRRSFGWGDGPHWTRCSLGGYRRTCSDWFGYTKGRSSVTGDCGRRISWLSGFRRRESLSWAGRSGGGRRDVHGGRGAVLGRFGYGGLGGALGDCWWRSARSWRTECSRMFDWGAGRGISSGRSSYWADKRGGGWRRRMSGWRDKCERINKKRDKR